MTQHPVAAICRTLRMARQTAYYAARAAARSYSFAGESHRGKKWSTVAPAQALARGFLEDSAEIYL